MRRRYWLKPWVTRRPQFGDFENLMVELETESPGDFVGYPRMEPVMFHDLVQRLTPRLTKQATNYRKPLCTGIKIAGTLRFLATGNSYRSLAFSFRVANCTISLFDREVCDAIIEEFGDEVVKTPSTHEEWQQLSSNLERRQMELSTCIGAMDGKHLAIKAPSELGSLYYHYKEFFSITLLGVVDADYMFIWADVGSNGSTSDGGVFNRSDRKT